MRVGIVIPALNEAAAIGRVVGDIPKGVAEEIIVVDNGSDDDTASVAEAAGARVVREPRRGYGFACLAGIAALSPDVDTVIFMDGDRSDDANQIPSLLEPIRRQEAELVIGSRSLGEREPGALTVQARFGNWFATRLIRLIWGVRYTDLGPFRALTRRTLDAMQMRDTTYGWTVEMQIKAAMMAIPVAEVPVRYRRRIGRSKISGTVRGTILAGAKILGAIAYYWNFGRGRRIVAIAPESRPSPSRGGTDA
ncbi:glycosyltransferase family 2 protein [Candidatus Poribacteria bacterium]|nr:glycosyltransferase family 2 protein [Candidatus Poribacteria bacterium]